MSCMMYFAVVNCFRLTPQKSFLQMLGTPNDSTWPGIFSNPDFVNGMLINPEMNLIWWSYNLLELF